MAARTASSAMVGREDGGCSAAVAVLGLRTRRQLEPRGADPEHTGWCFASRRIARSRPPPHSGVQVAGEEDSGCGEGSGEGSGENG